jgi:hypothetical protein
LGLETIDCPCFRLPRAATDPSENPCLQGNKADPREGPTRSHLRCRESGLEWIVDGLAHYPRRGLVSWTYTLQPRSLDRALELFTEGKLLTDNAALAREARRSGRADLEELFWLRAYRFGEDSPESLMGLCELYERQRRWDEMLGFLEHGRNKTLIGAQRFFPKWVKARVHANELKGVAERILLFKEVTDRSDSIGVLPSEYSLYLYLPLIYLRTGRLGKGMRILESQTGKWERRLLFPFAWSMLLALDRESLEPACSILWQRMELFDRLREYSKLSAESYPLRILDFFGSHLSETMPRDRTFLRPAARVLAELIRGAPEDCLRALSRCFPLH